MTREPAAFEDLPGGDIVVTGLRDLEQGVESAESLLVASFAPRLARLGIGLPQAGPTEPEHRLYELLARENPRSAHGRYNALVRRMVSFARALACAG
jgi:hypothetical protein